MLYLKHKIEIDAQISRVISGIDMDKMIQEIDVVIYPNPARDLATIGFNVERSSRVTVEAIDITGKVVQTIIDRDLPKGVFRTSWSVNELQEGIYYVRIKMGSDVVTKKVVVF